ncbi:DUF4422 domain-containing protein [Olsenella phocaeensis]|uniref:DUF4422 domain-containing protein n=1 Tax=Olsenella phocaeensis TaxID=1852385 RepID=UPI000930F682|nr:DUF4422 domain-containing protein [Olsenella phocaeensis]
MRDLCVSVAAHKRYWMPKDEAYLPVWAGSALKAPADLPQGWRRDDEGEGISEKNRGYCELTVMYWMWKNVTAKHLGLVHYRRHFSRSPLGGKTSRIASSDDFLYRFERHPVILPKERNYLIETSYSQYVHAHHSVDLDCTREIIKGKYPAMLSSYDECMSLTHGHRFNMLVMRNDLFDEYCSWLFGILSELEDELDTSGYSTNDQRVFGFVAERLLDSWILAHGVDYSEMGVVNMESQHWIKKGTSFLKRKVASGTIRD